MLQHRKMLHFHFVPFLQGIIFRFGKKVDYPRTELQKGQNDSKKKNFPYLNSFIGQILLGDRAATVDKAGEVLSLLAPSFPGGEAE